MSNAPSRTIAATAYARLARCFAPSIVADLAYWGRCGYIKTAVEDSGFHRFLPEGATLGQVFDHIYNFLWRHYRVEYVYKNALANKILLGRHSLRTSTLLTEFKAGAAQADAVILNGTSSLYEIKTELDTLDRLRGQLDAYRRVFDRIYVVTHESLLKKIERAAAPPVGVLLLTKRYTLRVVRDAEPNAGNTDPSAIFKILRRDEYSRIIESELGSTPDARGLDPYEESQRLFSLLSPAAAHGGMVRELRGRMNGASLAPFVHAVPHSLRLLCMARKLSVDQRTSILSALSEDFELNCRTPFSLTPVLRRRHVLSLSQGQEI